ncbi:phospholipase A2 inhibitor and Ly6/PLAUR domain-containing protein-like [Anabas testudineus]|uniref:phospholipase A2 inhibitor and Ly6/PLAUR domain-containing protein-like n=1 Tax=Anabas testudineus TaxID=64144 RepID=UPI000E453A71|nr:phospholipase A2 inhibitor and Ly6/PLAUR domain-containing protein-like [Anabas testudineus]
MKLILSLTLIWMLFSTAAGALQCETCQDTKCSNSFVQNCSSESACVSAAVQGSGFGGTVQQLYKTCAPFVVCPFLGSQTYSVSTTGLSASASAQCCNTDKCNSATLNFTSAQSVNNLQCYSCDATNSNCSIRIQCKGVEDRCFRANVTVQSNTSLTMGCVSSNLCSLASNFNLPIVQRISNLTLRKRS